MAELQSEVKMSLIQTSGFKKLMESEGGLNLDEPASVGGKSYGGISQKPYGEWRQKLCKIDDAPFQVEELAGDVIGTDWEKRSPLVIPDTFNVRVDVIEAFYTDYFKKAKLESLPDCLQYLHMDFYTNAAGHANKVLQKMCGFTGRDVDGVLGSKSVEELKKMNAQLIFDIREDSEADDKLITQYHNLKLEHYESIKTKNPGLYQKNIKGWTNRANHILSEIRAEYFSDENPTTSAIHEDEHIDVFEQHEEVSELENSDEDIKRIAQNIQGRISGMIEEEIKRYLKGIE